MPKLDLNTIHNIGALERTQLLTFLSPSKTFNVVGYLLTANRTYFLHFEDTAAWLHVCTQFPPPLYETGKIFVPYTTYYQDTVTYFVPITRQTLVCATRICCDKSLEPFGVLDPDNDDNYEPTPKN